VRQLATQPSCVGEKLLKKGDEAVLTPGTLLFFLAGKAEFDFSLCVCISIIHFIIQVNILTV
jgi:hypothetical protein